MSLDQISAAEDAARALLGVDVGCLLRPVLRPEHGPVVEAVARLPWGIEPVDVVAEHAHRLLMVETKRGGLVDPVHDEGDVPWMMMLIKLGDHPAIGARLARRWFAGMERLLWAGVPVSSVVLGVSSYAVARFEHDLDHDHEAWWWMQMAAAQAEHDERLGLSLVVVVRAARLLSWRAP